MPKIGDTQITGELVKLPLEELVEDVPIDEKRVARLAESLAKVGQVSPLLVWKEQCFVIDGFHRVRAMKKMGIKEADCFLYSCDEETFWNLRIINATTHREVHFSRIVDWIKKAFTATKWVDKMAVTDAFRVGPRRGAAFHKPLTPKERNELTAWVEEKARLWNLTPQRIVEILELAELADPKLVRQVRNEGKAGVLTETMLRAIVSKIKRSDLQKALVEKARKEGLRAKEVEVLSDQLAACQTEKEREELFSAPFQKQAQGEWPSHPALNLQKIRTGMVLEALQQINAILPQIKPPQPFDKEVQTAYKTIGLYLLYLGAEEPETKHSLAQPREIKKGQPKAKGEPQPNLKNARRRAQKTGQR